jgi:hypothetical protein
MSFAGINYWAVLIAAVAGYVAGAFWYWALSKPWTEAQGLTPEAFRANPSPVPFIVAFVANLVMAFMLAGIVGHLSIGEVTIKKGAISGTLIWFGFVATTLATNYSFGRRPLKLLLIDGGHWLLVLLLQGVVIGFMGLN